MNRKGSSFEVGMGQPMSESEEGYSWADHPPVSRGMVVPTLGGQQPNGTICLPTASTGWAVLGLGRKAHALSLKAGRRPFIPRGQMGGGRRESFRLGCSHKLLAGNPDTVVW